MLTAAVCGDIFASPTTEAVLEAIKAVTGPAGCLLIVYNYTGDRLNFGLAAEKARSLYGLKVQCVIGADDVALPSSPQPRGTAGTLFCHRFAGRLAEEGKSLDEIYKLTSEYERRIVSVGAAMSSCSLPGVIRDTRLDGNVYELGLGVHGEPGVETIPYEPASKILDRIVKLLVDGVAARKTNIAESNFTVLLNNLGSVSCLEMTFLAGKAIHKLGEQGIKISHSIVGPLITSQDMNGFSLSLVSHSTSEENPLLGSTGAPSWQELTPVKNTNYEAASKEFLIPYEADEEKEHEGDKLSDDIKNRIKSAMEAVIKIEPDLTAWDQKSGDGDCGSTFKKGAETILASLDSYPADPYHLCMALSKTIGQSMGGSSGIFLSMFFMAAAADIKANPGSDALVTGFKAGVKSIMHYGGAVVGSRTMVDALSPAMDSGTDIQSFAKLARAGAETTKDLKIATHGRSQYLAGSDLTGIPDPGAVAVATILEALAN